MKLPKLYAPVKIKFSSLRNGICNGGAVFDIDTVVERVCRRVICSGGWKWQLVNYEQNRFLWTEMEIDKEVLDMNGSELEFEFA